MRAFGGAAVLRCEGDLEGVGVSESDGFREALVIGNSTNWCQIRWTCLERVSTIKHKLYILFFKSSANSGTFGVN